MEGSEIGAAITSMQSSKDHGSLDQSASNNFKYVNGQPSSSEYYPSKLPQFVTDNFQSFSSLRSESSPYSLRQTQLSIPYQYDVLLMYDPDDNVSYLNELLEHLAPQQLKIFDFNRDAPAGLPQQKVLQDTLRMCRYTCIMITHKFITNFWLQFRADMSIQDMLDNREKLYSVIVIVMDRTVMKSDLPLDLMTLSPLFIGDRYFKDKIKRTFSKEMPFPPSVHTTSSFIKQPLPISHLPPSYNDISRSESFHRSPHSVGGTDRYATHQSANCVKLPSSQCLNSDFERISVSTNPQVDRGILSGRYNSQLNSLEPNSRLPQEHSDSTYLMPPSLFPSYNSESGNPISAARVVQREMSIIVNSTGSREPLEILETGSISKYGKSDSDHSSMMQKAVDGGVTSTSSSDGNASVETTGSSHGRGCVEDFSFLNCSDGINTDQHSANVRNEFDQPAFFSISNTEFMQSSNSEYSDLEISESSELHLTVTQENEESLSNVTNILQSTSVAPAHFSQLMQGEIAYSSLPRAFTRNDANDSTIPRCNSLGLSRAKILPLKKLSHLTDDASCTSLPECSAKEGLKNSPPKRSFSLRSLFGSQKSKKEKFLKGKRK